MQRNMSTSASRIFCVLLGIALLVISMAGCGGGNSSQAPSRLAVGNWGGSLNSGNSEVFPATLTVSASGGQMVFACNGVGQYNGTVTLDSTGHFSVTGTSSSSCCTNDSTSTRFDGSVQNNVLTLTLSNASNGVSLGTFTLKFGQAAPAANVGCPG